MVHHVLQLVKARPVELLEHLELGRAREHSLGARRLARQHQIAQQQLLGRRRRQSAEGLQAHGRPTAALQLGSQRHQLSWQLPARAAMHHQQQAPGGDGREAATKALRHLGIQLAKAQGHQGPAGAGQAGQQIHRWGSQLGIQIGGEGAEHNPQLGPGPHRQAPSHPLQRCAPQVLSNRRLQPGLQHRPGLTLALVTQQGKQGRRHGGGQLRSKGSRARGQLLKQPGSTGPIQVAQHLGGYGGIGLGLQAPPAQQAQLGRRIQSLRQDG